MTIKSKYNNIYWSSLVCLFRIHQCVPNRIVVSLCSLRCDSYLPSLLTQRSIHLANYISVIYLFFKTIFAMMQTEGWAFDRVHNSRRCRPLSQRHLTAPQGCLVSNFWPCDLDLWHFDLIFIDGRAILIAILIAEFGNFSFSRFGFIVRAVKITHTQTDRQNHRGGSTLYSRDYRRRE